MTIHKLFDMNLQLFASETMKRSDVARAMYVGTKEVMMRNLKKPRTEQWKQIATIKTSDKMEETYDTIGNLRPAQIKVEGEAFEYGKIIEGNKTTVKNDTIVNGFSVSMEAKEDEKWGIVPEAKTNELLRTMMSERERAVAKVWDDTTTAVGADGVAYAANNHPLLNKAGVYNDNLIEGLFNRDNYNAAVNMFHDWKNHQGEKFDTEATTILTHKNNQTFLLAMLESAYLPHEATTIMTKNTLPKLKPIFNTYINKTKYHVIDETIDSAILQRRKGLVTEYDYDKRNTFNFFFNVHERYKAGMINPGFGFVTITNQAGA